MENEIQEISEKEFEEVEKQTDKKTSQLHYDEKLEKFNYDKNNIISSVLKDDIVCQKNKQKVVMDYGIILLPKNKRNRSTNNL